MAKKTVKKTSKPPARIAPAMKKKGKPKPKMQPLGGYFGGLGGTGASGGMP